MCDIPFDDTRWLKSQQQASSRKAGRKGKAPARVAARKKKAGAAKRPAKKRK
jgi:hypothetical protein